MPGRTVVQFREEIHRLTEAGETVKVHMGCGFNVWKGWLNVQLNVYPRQKDFNFYRFNASNRWPCPPDSVDYIFHEDFLEHLNQRQQMRFLAETMRVMKPGAVHHVSIPSLEWSIVTRSEVGKGAEGIYDDWKRWRHELLHTYETLEVHAKIIGFEVRPSKRQPFATRPGSDRDAEHGNIFADLIKPE